MRRPPNEGSLDGLIDAPRPWPTLALGWDEYRPRDVRASGAVTPESEVPMCDDPSNAMRLYEAATQAIDAADLEFEVDDGGSHRLIRVAVPVDPWLRLQRATLEAGKEER
jgi:hypothetical protein